MSEERREEEESEFDADQLAALARPSLAPAEDDDDDDDDDDEGPLDLRALATSMAPPAPDDDEDDDDDDEALGVAATVAAPISEPVAAKSGAKAGAAKVSGAKAGGAKASGATAKSAAPAKSGTPSPVPAAAAPESSSGTGKMLLGLVIGVAVAAGAYAAWGRTDGPLVNDEPVAVAGIRDEGLGTRESGSVVAPEGSEVRDEPELVEEPVVEANDLDEVADEAIETAPEASREPSGTTRREPDRRGGGDRVAAPDTAMEAVAMEPDMEAVVAAEPDMAPVVAVNPTATSEMASGMDDMDDLLNRALGGTPAAGGTQTVMTAEPAPMEDTSALPDVPSRAAVTRALGGLMPRMRRCAGDQVGTATARIRVGNDGQVQAANIGGSPFGGTPQGACMEDVVRTARFPRFQRTNFDVTYPFSIRPLN